MRHEKTTAIIMLILLTTTVFFGVVSFAVLTSADLALPDADPLDIDQKMRTYDYGLEVSGGLKSSSVLPKTSDSAVGDVKTWLSLDDYNGYYFFTDFELKAIGVYAEIWVQVNRSFPRGDPRNDPTYTDSDGRYHYPEITDAQIAYLLDQFDTNIYPEDTTYFGTPDFHNGSNSLLEAWGYVPPGYYDDENGRTAILVSNVRDEAYYDSSYPYYIAGFFSSSLEGYFDRNAISIDSHQWYRRVGAEGTTWDSEVMPGFTYPPVDRPNLYEGTIAHEYQHLIHRDYNPSDPSWMNEACSMFAEPLCGYPIDYGSVIRFLYSPDNSLTLWGDQGGINILADYGSSFLWAMYLNDHYGGSDFLSHFVEAGIPGVDGIEATLDFLGYEESFMDVYHDWRIANLLDLPYGKYGYSTLDLNPETNPLLEDTGLTVHSMHGGKIPWTSAAEEFGNTFSWDGDDTGISEIGSFGSDYITFPNLNKLNFFYFDGDDTSYTPGWELINGVWYSDDKDLMDTLIFGEAHVDAGDPTLVMTTYWDIEDFWDFGFVQVSTDGGASWTSLELAPYTTYDHDPQAIDTAVINLPGLTGWSVDWLTLTFDLTAYADQDILIGFRYVTDWGTTFDGWSIEDNVQVSGTKVELSRFVPFPEADFMVTFVAKTTYWVWGWHHHKQLKTFYNIWDMHLWDVNEYGMTWSYINKQNTEVFMIVSPVMNEGLVDYQFKTWNPRHAWYWC